MWEIFPRQVQSVVRFVVSQTVLLSHVRPNDGSTPLPALVRALGRVLRPFVRLMLASGVTYPRVAELLKALFVEIADRDFRLADKPSTDSRISLLSGVHRKDVRRLRAMDAPPEEIEPESLSFGGRLVTTWLSDKRFVDSRGQTLPLSRTRTGGDRPSFEDLVASRSTDIRPRVVLDEWLRLGIVRVDEHDRLVLNTEAFVPQAGFDEKMYFFAHNLHDHAAAAVGNVLADRPAQLERSLIYEGLTAADVESVQERARELGSRMLKDLNRLATDREAEQSNSREGLRRFTCGVYFYSEPVADPAFTTQK
jgi:Family of unknown function (DUF6502)